MSAVIQLEGLTKHYGSARGIVDVDLEVSEGEVFGFLGPNGAGKTTTIRLIMDLIRPSEGTARVFSLDARRDATLIQARTGYMPGELALYGGLTGIEMLKYAANLRGGVDWAFVEGLAERLDCDLSRPIGTLSTGNKHKVGLIHALMHRPELLILDEPTSGLDPIVQRELHRLLEEVRAEGRTVFLSSHILPEVESLCDRVGIIREGRLVTIQQVEALKESALSHLEFHFAAEVSADEFSSLPGVREVTAEGTVVRCTVSGSVDAVVKAAALHEVLDLVSHEPSLEQVFLAYYTGESGDAG
ncbi:MAG: ABC transporter ATP-binding protein [Chloroflexi bacterium]|nr:ABC transporter ATP-binding protein [Chloroflexota bacterium]